jgi:hypothetical protein
MGLLDEAIREHLELKRRRGADAGEISRAESEALGPVRRAPDGTPDLAPIPMPEAPAKPPVANDEVPLGHDVEPDWKDETAARADDPPTPAYEPPPIPAAPAPAPAPAPDPGYAMPPAVPPPPAYDEPPPVPAAPDPGPGYVMPPAVPPPPVYDEHPPGFEDLDEPGEEPPAEPPRAKRGLRLRLRRHGASDEPAPAAPPRPSFEELERPVAAHESPPAAYQPPPPPYVPPPSPIQPPPAHDPDTAPSDGDPAGEDLLEETPEFLEETPDHDRLWFEQRPPRGFDFDK